MTTAIDDRLRKFIENLQHEAVDDVAAGSRRRHARTTAQPPPPPPVRKHPAVKEHPASSRPSNQRRTTLYSWITTVLIVLLLVATGVAYYMHREERAAISSRIDAIMRAPLATPLEDQLLELPWQQLTPDNQWHDLAVDLPAMLSEQGWQEGRQVKRLIIRSAGRLRFDDICISER